ncbi:hypothetical protein I7I50_04585 [Histoplasma capsulatum G186AR]|uniref:Secreted protein n=1 Tax=Ajellomyces capsulatus TaxID=5037 RepID=A0A8H7YPY1_AJECA|nr:hypothetical protein I7I52_05494 [Histoplasma capsulatum]QSS75449.1 hypothetical protein I7I50_04585 [Histoplasma capsulatum G186AR]
MLLSFQFLLLTQFSLFLEQTTLSSSITTPCANSQRLMTGPAGSSLTSHSYNSSHGPPRFNLASLSPTVMSSPSAHLRQLFRQQNVSAV